MFAQRSNASTDSNRPDAAGCRRNLGYRVTPRYAWLDRRWIVTDGLASLGGPFGWTQGRQPRGCPYRGRFNASPIPTCRTLFLRQGMARTDAQHRDLATVMGVMRDQVTEKSSHIRTKAFDAAVGLPRRGHRPHSKTDSLLQSSRSLRRSNGGAIELSWNLARLCGSLQPHHPTLCM